MHEIYISIDRGYALYDHLRAAIRRKVSSELKVLKGVEIHALLPSLREAIQRFLSSHPEKSYVHSISVLGVGILWPPSLVSVASECVDGSLLF